MIHVGNIVFLFLLYLRLLQQVTRSIMFSDMLSVRPSARWLSVCSLSLTPVSPSTDLRYISVLNGGITIKLGTNIQHARGHRWKGFQGQRSKVKVIVRPNALLWRRHNTAYRHFDGIASRLTYLYLPLSGKQRLSTICEIKTKRNDDRVINEERMNNDDTGGFVSDEFARLDVAEAREERANVVLWHGLWQVVDNEIGTRLGAVLLLLLLVRRCGRRRRRRRRRRRWRRRAVDGRRRAVDAAAAAAQMRLEGAGRRLRLRRTLWWRRLRRRTLHVHVHSAGAVHSSAFSAVAGDLPVTNRTIFSLEYNRQVLPAICESNSVERRKRKAENAKVRKRSCIASA